MAFKDKSLSEASVYRCLNEFERGRVALAEKAGRPLTEENLPEVGITHEEIRHIRRLDRKGYVELYEGIFSQRALFHTAHGAI
ncbi:hypothetical protein EVAR_10017_1 [Eumeta japonica]|uniref:Uncharacterized protein n=1 Tax=Eumeta variegata TaxID=151549 RepID=A0A4C1TR36_EUMVA|nr:hypothetical protein EVAR_10017_1 [Eumeta japonica]